MTQTQIDEFRTVVRRYTLVAALDGTIGAFGGITYKSEEWIRANTRLVDAQGRSYAPLSEEDIDADMNNLLTVLKPTITNIIGPMGKNMHFLVFPSKTDAGGRIASAKGKGRLKVAIAKQEFRWRLPLDSLLPVKTCPTCEEECKGSWKFCPWCGTSLSPRE